MKSITALLIIFTVSCFSADALPKAADPIIAEMVSANAKATTEAIKKLQKAQDDLTKKGDLEGAMATKKYIEGLQKSLASADAAPGKSTSISGSWELSFNGNRQGIVTFTPDGKVANPWNENWKLESKDKKTTINTDKSGMKHITITDIQDDVMKGVSGIGQAIEFKRNKD